MYRLCKHTFECTTLKLNPTREMDAPLIFAANLSRNPDSRWAEHHWSQLMERWLLTRAPATMQL